MAAFWGFSFGVGFGGVWFSIGAFWWVCGVVCGGFGWCGFGFVVFGFGLVQGWCRVGKCEVGWLMFDFAVLWIWFTVVWFIVMILWLWQWFVHLLRELVGFTCGMDFLVGFAAVLWWFGLWYFGLLGILAYCRVGII